MDQVGLLPAPDRSKSDPTVADNYRGHAMPARRRKIRVPERLAVVMGVDIDPSGRHQQAAGVDFAPARPSLAADGRDHTAIDCEVAAMGRRAGAINDCAVPDYGIMHDRISLNLHKTGDAAAPLRCLLPNTCVRIWERRMPDLAPWGSSSVQCSRRGKPPRLDAFP